VRKRSPARLDRFRHVASLGDLHDYRLLGLPDAARSVGIGGKRLAQMRGLLLHPKRRGRCLDPHVLARYHKGAVVERSLSRRGHFHRNERRTRRLVARGAEHRNRVLRSNECELQLLKFVGQASQTGQVASRAPQTAVENGPASQSPAALLAGHISPATLHPRLLGCHVPTSLDGSSGYEPPAPPMTMPPRPVPTPTKPAPPPSAPGARPGRRFGSVTRS